MDLVEWISSIEDFRSQPVKYSHIQLGVIISGVLFAWGQTLVAITICSDEYSDTLSIPTTIQVGCVGTAKAQVVIVTARERRTLTKETTTLFIFGYTLLNVNPSDVKTARP